MPMGKHMGMETHRSELLVITFVEHPKFEVINLRQGPLFMTSDIHRYTQVHTKVTENIDGLTRCAKFSQRKLRCYVSNRAEM